MQAESLTLPVQQWCQALSLARSLFGGGVVAAVWPRWFYERTDIYLSVVYAGRGGIKLVSESRGTLRLDFYLYVCIRMVAVGGGM